MSGLFDVARCAGTQACTSFPAALHARDIKHTHCHLQLCVSVTTKKQASSQLTSSTSSDRQDRRSKKKRSMFVAVKPRLSKMLPVQYRGCAACQGASPRAGTIVPPHNHWCKTRHARSLHWANARRVSHLDGGEEVSTQKEDVSGVVEKIVDEIFFLPVKRPAVRPGIVCFPAPQSLLDEETHTCNFIWNAGSLY